LAWYHGDRGEHRVSRGEFAIITILFLIGGGILWRYERVSEALSDADSTAALSRSGANAPPDDKSIAVLPFVDMSAERNQEYMSDGIAEELLNSLAKIPELQVIARTSSFAFKGEKIDIAEIAKRLHVAHVLEGSVRKSGNTVRITAQLVRASDRSNLWSHTYDRQMTDVFKVQDEIAAAVVSELKIKLLGAAPKTKVTDPKAYALFLQAREISFQFSAAALEQAIALYQQALALDPRYAPAWIGLADTYLRQIAGGLRLADEGTRLSRDATTKALSIDPQYAPAHAMLGLIAIVYDGDLAAAARHLEHALALEPANPDSINLAGFLVRRLGRLDQAIAIGEHVTTLDPINADAYDDLGFSYFYDGRYDEAIAMFRTVLRLTPGSILRHEAIGEALLIKGDATAALAETKYEVDDAARLLGLSMIYRALGQEAQSDAALRELVEKYESTMSYGIAYAMAYRGEADHAFEWLDKAVRYHDPALGSIAAQPMFANIHGDPRWLPFLRKLGMAPEQLAAIQFDVKVPK
jgi:TolB-like protein/cytochrome c-type biogenesis protein CcmH/NrfG